MTARALICLLWLAPDKMTIAQLRRLIVKHMEAERRGR
jgi:hypothetical protein